MEKIKNKDTTDDKKENSRLTTNLISPEVAEEIFIKFGGNLPKRAPKRKKKNNKNINIIKEV